MQYLSLSDSKYAQIEDVILKSFPKACILWIEKNENTTLEQLFIEYSLKFPNPRIQQLYHGTSEDIARLIMKEGFDPSKNKSSFYGNGVYFSPFANVSQWYSKKSQDDISFFLVCDVVVGKSCVGLLNQDIPSDYQSAVNNLIKPTEIVVNKKEAAFPRYLVAFYRDANTGYGSSSITK